MNQNASASSCSSFPGDPSQPILACDGQGLKRLFGASLQWMERHAAVINSLNVFPVPDGDTGTNMYLTLQAAYQEIAHLPNQEVGVIAYHASRGALMGARGNSGVILSQILRGFAQGLENTHQFDAAGFAQAFRRGATVAYQAVIKPVEGTILTVVRESGETAVQIANQVKDLREMFEYVLHAAQDSVARTPQLLPVLREAGVVDAGGQGLYVILEGMTKCLRREDLQTDVALSHAVDLDTSEPEAGYGYDVQYVIQGSNLDVTQIRADIAAMGESALVVGDASAVKVHVHTPHPGDPINYGTRLGSLSRVIVENMQEQYQEFIMGQAAPAAPPAPQREITTATVVVSPGPGLDRVFESLGANVIVPGGQTMNPSTEQLLQAIEDAPAAEVVVLPNNGNIVLAAQQAQALSSKHVRVVPTKTVPQGVSALLAYNDHIAADENAGAMERAAGDVHTAEITTAVRDVSLNGLQVRQGEVIGLIDDELKIVGQDLDTVIDQVLDHIAEGIEILTFYYGDTVSEAEAQQVAERITAQLPGIEIEVVEGGQPHYHYIISAE